MVSDPPANDDGRDCIALRNGAVDDVIPSQALNCGRDDRNAYAGSDEAERSLQLPHFAHRARLDVMISQYVEQLVGIAGSWFARVENQRFMRGGV